MTDNQTPDSVPAPGSLPESVPIPGMGVPSSVPAAPSAKTAPEPSRNMRAIDARTADKWDVELKCRSVAGIASAEVQAAHEAYERHDDYVSDNYRVLADDWIERATEREAAAIAEYVNAGKDVPAKRESEVDKAIRARPLALATARKLRDDVYKADRAARDAFSREALAAIPRLRSEVSEALTAAETALGEFMRAVTAANVTNGDLIAVRVAVEKLPPLVVQSLAVSLIDGQAGISRLDDAIQNARRRVGPIGDGE
ncbi:hypothetical protein ACFY4C_40200 [Actinomadura viridis]|uniref:hypothetical protein n=1 Tax=Actinomadura viridis TaxID=58110 RepID=UPI0036A73641